MLSIVNADRRAATLQYCSNGQSKRFDMYQTPSGCVQLALTAEAYVAAALFGYGCPGSGQPYRGMGCSLIVEQNSVEKQSIKMPRFYRIFFNY